MKTKLFLALFAFFGILTQALAQCSAVAEVFVTRSTPPTIACYPGPMSTGPFTYAWAFGDGTTTTQQQPTHVYATTGIYTVTLAITDANNCVANVTKLVDFANPCNSHFTVNNGGGNVVQFDGSSTTGVISQVNWDFGDGSPQATYSTSPNHTYLDPGLYTACQTISNSATGCNSTFCDTVRVNSFSCGTNVRVVSTLFPNNEVHFELAGSVILPGPPVNNLIYTFNYGDGSPTDTARQHTYAQPGTYNVCVTTSGFIHGNTVSPCSDYACTSITINTCSFVPFRDSVVAPQTVFFTNDNANNAGGGGGCSASIVHWDFGDGTSLDTIGFAATLYHHYPQNGTYQVCLSMTDATGCQGYLCQTVVVTGGSCGLSLGIVQTPQPFGQTNYLVEVFNGTANYTFHWNHNDEATQTITAPVGVVYCVTATDIYSGCTAVTCDSSAFCRTLFNYDPLTQNQIRFNDLSANFATKTWDFGDGTTSNDANPTHLFTSTGTFHVCLNTLNLPLNPCDPIANLPLPCPPQCTQGQYCMDFPIGAVDTSCLHSECVFPGDVNKDQTVNNFDLLPLGIGYGIYGTPRALAEQNITFYGHSAANWTYNVAAGNINYKHLDGDGNGYIDISDKYAIDANYGRTHNTIVPTNRLNSLAAIPLTLQFTADTVVAAGSTYTYINADILFGTPAQPATNVYGVAFTVNYPAGMSVANTTYAQYDYNSWFGTGNQVLGLSHDNPTSGQLDLAYVRTNRANKSGNGRIALVSWVITDNINGRGIDNIMREFAASISNIRIIDRFNVEKTSIGVGDSTVVVYSTSTATDNQNTWQQAVQVFPNPVDDILNISLGETKGTSLQLQNALGQTVITDIIQDRNTAKLNVSILPAGVYTLTINTEKGNVTKKVVIE